MWQNTTRLDHLHWIILLWHTAEEITPVKVHMFHGLQRVRAALFKGSDTLKNFKLAVDRQVDRLMSDCSMSPTLPFCGESKYERGGSKKIHEIWFCQSVVHSDDSEVHLRTLETYNKLLSLNQKLTESFPVIFLTPEALQAMLAGDDKTKKKK